jgi:hypothetical protein
MPTSNQNFLVPQEREANKRFRALLIQKAEADPEFQAVLREKCKQDDEFFFNTFAWTFDPRLADPVIPFILYPKQVKLITWLNYLLDKSRTEKVNGLIDKPRDVGATFTVMTWILKKFIFEEFSARVGSRKEDYVDKRGEQDTLFFKFDFTWERLPHWLLTEPISRASMLLTKGTNNISGESANPNFGRGGRKTITVFDEHAFWEWARSSWESAGESTNFRLSMSTPPETGRDSHFYKLLTGQMGSVEKFEFDWTDVPTRDQQWMLKQRETKSEEELAREVLKSYEGTLEGKVYATDFRLVKLSTVDYKPHLPLFIHWDFGLDTVAMGWMQKDMETNKLYLIDSYSNSNKPIDFYVPFVTGVIKSGIQGEQVIHEYTPHERTIIERHAKWAKTITHFGDPDVNKRTLTTGESTKDVLERFGIYVQSTSWAGRAWQDIKEKTKLSFRRLEINEARNEVFISAMRNAKYPKRREGSQSTSEPIKPVHDWTSHFRSSYEYFIDNEPEADEFAFVSARDRLIVSLPDI